MKRRVVITVLAATLAAVHPRVDADGAPTAAAADTTVAQVGATYLTQRDLDAYLQRLYQIGVPQVPNARVDTGLRQNALDALVRSRALALQAEAELSAERKAAIEAQVRLFRERALVDAWMADQGLGPTVSSGAIEAYYQAHGEAFGRQRVDHYQLLMASGQGEEGRRDALLAELGQAAQWDDWQAAYVRLRQAGYNLELHNDTSRAAPLHPRLAKALQGLEPGQVSAPGLLNGRPYVVRLVRIEEQPGKTLEEVRESIFKQLQARAARQRIDELSDAALERVEVTYPTAGANP